MSLFHMHLVANTLLQSGKYRIINVLGQGGFGITYEAEQVALHRRVAIKEFFMKDYCERDESTSRVTLGAASGSKELVERFRKKFIKEAQAIALLNHPNIVKIIDVFEENGTAYYVMNYLEGGSLADLCKDGCCLTEDKALAYVQQIALALDYLHHRPEPLNHLDIKPSNVLLDENGNAVLIDFGISKRYDEKGSQTSSTPVGISHGYSPLEQYKDGGVRAFSPATDIYSLGATLYKLLTGKTPPQASDILESGVPETPGVSSAVRNTIVAAMQPRRKDRPQSIASYLALLGGPNGAGTTNVEGDEDDTIVNVTGRSDGRKNGDRDKGPVFGCDSDSSGKGTPKTLLWALIGEAAAASMIVAVVVGGLGKRGGGEVIIPIDTTSVAASVTPISSSNPDSIHQISPMESVPGSIKFLSTPPGAVIWLDGMNTRKTTPEILEDIAPGKHSVMLVLEGYEDKGGVVTVSAGRRATLSRTLTAMPVKVLTKQGADTRPVVAEIPTTGTLFGHDWVNLGLPSGLKWATCNVGASSPSDNGFYFAWGETTSKKDFTWSNYTFWMSGLKFYKYTTDEEHSYQGSADNKEVLDKADDAARVNWGGGWRMPTNEEIVELVNNCTWVWTSKGGKAGYEVISKLNNKSIFLPAAGCQKGTTLYNVGSYGYYWSSTLERYSPEHALILNFYNGKHVCDGLFSRYVGRSVRPVTE